MQTPTPGQVIQGYVFNGGDPADPSSWTPEAGAVQQPSGASGMPQPGQVMDGYIFKGGNPADPVSWVPETESRGFFDVIKDTGLEATSAAASGVGALTEFVAPGNRFAQGVDDFTKTLGEMQTPQTQAAKLAFAQQMEEAEGVGDEVSAVLSYALENPLLAAAQAAGSFVIPGTTIKGAGLIARGLGAGARATRAAGIGAGVATGAALGGGEAGGTAYELVMQTPDETLDTQEEFQQLIGAGMEREQAKEVLATTAARKAQILPTLVGGAFGAVGVERLLAGAGGYSGSIAARTFKGFGSEAVQEGVEEGVTTFEGQRAAAEVNPEIDPSKGVAGAVTFGAILGGTTGAGVAALSRSAEQLEAERDKLLEERITKAATVEEAIRAAEEMADVNAAIPDLDQALAQYSSRAIEEAETDPTAMRAGPGVTPLAEGEQVQDRLEQAAASPVELDPVVERLQSASRQGEIRLPEEVNQTVTQIQNAIARRNGVALPAEAEFLQRYNLGTPFDRVARPEEIGLAPPPAQQIQPAQSEVIQTLRDQPRESTRLQQPRAFTPTPELQGARTPAPEIPVIDRTQAAVNVAARTNTPAAQAFAGQARRGEITPQDVQASLAAQDREGFEVDNRLQAAAQQAQPAVDVTAQRIEQAAAAAPVSNVTQITGRLQTLAEAGFAERQGRIQVQRSPAREVNGTLDLGQGRVARIVTRDQLSLDAPVIKTATNVRQQLSRSQYDVLDRVAKVFGKEVKVIEGANVDAFVNESTPNTIYVNRETSIQPTSLVFHEMAHLLQKDNREAYDALKDVVLAQASEQDRKAFADYYEAGSEFDADELVADSFGSILAKPETLNQVFSNISQTYGTNRARAIVTRLAASLTRVINRVLKTFKTKDYKTVGAFVGKTEQDLQTLKEAVTQAATIYARQQRPVVQAQAAPAVQPTQSAATPSRVMFEVAPDPRNAELKQRWDALPVQEKNAISAEVAQEVMPEVLRRAGVKGTVQPQFGGWMDDTNPSFAVISDDPKGVVEAAKLAGYGLRQESIMVIQGKAFEKSLPTGVISITLPSSVNGKDLNAVSDFYRTVRAVNPELIQGHTTVGQDMILAVPPESVEALARSIAEVTPEGTTVTSNDAFVAFYDQGDYDYGNIQGAQRETVRFANSVRSKTDESLRRISERGNRPAETQTAQAASTVRAETGRTEQDRIRLSTRRAVQEVKDYARQFEPDFFRTPKSNSVAMEDIVADIAPSVTTQRMPEGFYPDADETFTLDIAGRMAFISRKENAVWVNVGDLEPGLDGARVYQIAGAFAYNNGYTLIGDPVSISEAGKLRRLENMISLSLKYGSSDFMKPHDQMLGWKGLMWSGTSDDKLAFLLRTSQRVVREQVPEALNVKFNPDTGEFTNSAGQTMGPADFADMARQARVGKTETEREGMPGSGTVRLAIVFNSLLERAGINQPETVGTLPDQSSRRTETLRTNLSGIRASTRRESADKAFNAEEIARLNVPDYKSREKLVEMPIDDFIALANKGRDSDKLKQSKSLLARGIPFETIPFLNVEKDGRVTGHEGRHRGLALKDAGFESMPVILRSANIRWSEQNNPDNRDYVPNWPASLKAQNAAADTTVEVPFPVTREQATAPYLALKKASTRRDQTETPEFKRWFGDSKVVDAEGKPLVVYHGSSTNVNVFDVSKIGSRDAGFFGSGFYFTPDESVAETYALTALSDSETDETSVIPAYISLKNPFMWDMTQGAENATKAALEKVGIKRTNVRGNTASLSNAKERDTFNRMVREQGYDGVIVKDEDGIQEVIAFDPTQIKSAIGNRGTFDATNPDIRFSTRRDQTETPEFKRWSENAPLIASGFETGKAFVAKSYHGTNAVEDFSSFDLSKGGKQTGAESAQMAVFSTDNFEVAQSYAENIGVGGMLGLYFNGLENYKGNPEFDRLLKVQESESKKLNKAYETYKTNLTDALVKSMPTIKEMPESVQTNLKSNAAIILPEETRNDIFSKTVKPVEDAYNKASQDVTKWATARKVSETPQRVMPLFVKMKNPKVYDAGGKTPGEFPLADKIDSAKKAGHDGVVFVNIKDPDQAATHFAVFNPSQIKSAIGNRGTFDATNPDIRFSTEREAAFEVAQPSRVDNVVRKLQDKNVDLKRVQEAIKKESGPIEEEADAYLKEELYHGRAAKQSVDFLNFQLTPLLQELRMRKVPLKDFETYLWNRHAEERNEQIAKVNDRFPDGGSGIPTEKARAYLAGLSDAQRKTYEALAARVDRMVNENLQMMVDTGLESQETVNAMKQAYRNYVPLMRAESASYTGRGQGYSIRGATTKRALGSDKPVDNILASLVDQREKIITRAEKARVGRALMGLALQNPNEDFWFVFDPLLNKAERTAAQRVELRNQLERLGFDPELAEEISSQPYTEEMGPSGKVVLRPNRKLMEAPNAVAVRINGEDKFVVMNQENERARKMAEALTNLDAPRLEGAMGILAKASRYFASINTQYNPVFGIINLMRDTQGAMINLTSTEIAGEQVKVTRGIGPALKATYDAARARRSGKLATGEWADLYDRFQNVGAQTGFRDMFDNPTQRTQRQLKAIAEPGPWRKLDEKVRQPIFNWLSDYNESLENAVRLSAFKAALDKGLSDERAASIAKNLTVNFNRKGQIGAQAGAVYAFYNASVQGTARLVEALNGPKGRQILAGGLLLGASQPLILALAGFDDEQPPEFVRERNLVIPVPGGDGKFISVPMPLGLHVIPNVGRIAMEQVMGRTQQNVTESLGKLFLTVVGAFNPIGTGTFLQTLSPTVLDPAVALSENKDFAGRPIAREDFSSNKPTPGYTRTKENSIDTLIPVSKALNYLTGGSEFTKGMVSPTPDQIEYAIAQLTGGVGREISKVVQVAETSVTGEELPIYKRPLIGRLYGDANTQASQAGQFYENLRALHDHKLEIEGRVEAGRPYQDYVTENPEAALYKMAERVEREVQKLRRNKRLLKERGAGPETIRQIEDAITAKMNRLNEQVKWIRNQTT